MLLIRGKGRGTAKFFSFLVISLSLSKQLAFTVSLQKILFKRECVTHSLHERGAGKLSFTHSFNHCFFKPTA